MSGNFYGDFAGVTDSTRVRKPPGGESSDIFGLETRQKCQEQQTHEKNDQGNKSNQGHDIGTVKDNKFKETSARSGDTLYLDYDKEPNQMHCQQMQSMYHNFPYEKQEFVKEGVSNLRNDEHDIPLAGGKEYAGLTNKTRVRKQPGGDTHDIFGMEGRQQSQAEEKRLLSQLESKLDENQAGFPNITNQLQSVQINVENFEGLFLQGDKENINLLREDGVEKENILKQKSHDDEEDSKLPTKMYLSRNPITGEVSERKVSKGFKLVDSSNVAPSPCPIHKPEQNKTSVKIRQPPGGVSSFFFY
ncbi:hypothetical protein JTE90_016935 [Oedothorax gibbosus]|uniref:Microtubule-associated protein Jupiter n=1 Tax=Oedothorax gibbosus TaxID=931172 RepID=A0AAV6UT06_9ARAC|nr:hypothetical protein JTE90_016935 [Oedothorax gibbosus]